MSMSMRDAPKMARARAAKKVRSAEIKHRAAKWYIKRKKLLEGLKTVIKWQD